MGGGHYLVSFDYTDPGFPRTTCFRPSSGCAAGRHGRHQVLHYPEFGLASEGGFENRDATTAFAYREIFRVVRKCLGPYAFVDQRILGTK